MRTARARSSGSIFFGMSSFSSTQTGAASNLGRFRSNNPIERLNREIKRRADVVQIFPDRGSVTRLIGAILLEQHEEWHYGERRYLSEVSMRRLIDTLTKDTRDPYSALAISA